MGKIDKDGPGFEFPQPLYETYNGSFQNKICLACGSAPATSVLRTTEEEIVPLCKHCSCDWNFYGYYILRRVKPKTLVWNMAKHKLANWFRSQSAITCYQDLQRFAAWAKRMKKYI